jgi:hypothetical protein
MADLQINIAVVDGKEPRNWEIFDQTSLGELVKKIGTVSALAEGYLENKKINVDVLLDDVASLQDGQCRSISGIIVDGDLLLQYPLDAKNPCLARLQRVLQIMGKDKTAIFRQFGIRIWIVGKKHPASYSYPYRYKAILEKIVRILQVKASEIKVSFVRSFEVAETELNDLAEELALIEEFVSLESR